MAETDFMEFPKMARLSREMIITEKIDGTNGQILITPVVLEPSLEDPNIIATINSTTGEYTIRAGSRNKWVIPGKTTDNSGFAGWVKNNAVELVSGLGEGRHFGEWWGSGIQRGYGMKEKVFSLFNVARWRDSNIRPSCCRVVPELFEGPFDTKVAEDILHILSKEGSAAAPGFMKPEGIVVWHVAGNFGLKKTIEKDEVPKSLANATL